MHSIKNYIYLIYDVIDFFVREISQVDIVTYLLTQ